VDEQPNVVGESSVLAWADIALVVAASLGLLSLVLAAAAAYFVMRNQGHFYTAKVRSTHVGDEELEPGDR
jgi:hypothetical protein